MDGGLLGGMLSPGFPRGLDILGKCVKGEGGQKMRNTGDKEDEEDKAQVEGGRRSGVGVCGVSWASVMWPPGVRGPRALLLSGAGGQRCVSAKTFEGWARPAFRAMQGG